jgi:hypothetical protein
VFVARASEEIDAQQRPAFEIKRTFALFVQALVQLGIAPVPRVFLLKIEIEVIGNSLNGLPLRSTESCTQRSMTLDESGKRAP